MERESTTPFHGLLVSNPNWTGILACSPEGVSITMNQRSHSPVTLVYSYSHLDSQFRQSMEEALALLKKEGLLEGWSDHRILPGQQISAAVKAKMDGADIIVFLLSPAFIASDQCMDEWKYAKQLEDEGRPLCRIPIIVRGCAWLDLLGRDDDIKALPDDGVPVTSFEDPDSAWLQVYKGIKAVVEELNSSFTAKPDFIKDMAKTDFLGERHIDLRDIFVFPRLLYRTPRKSETEELEQVVTTHDDLLRFGRVLVHGPDTSGKTALARHTLLTLVNADKPVLYIDFSEVTGRLDDKFLHETYRSQFNGDYTLWSKQPGKVLVADNLSAHPRQIDFLLSAETTFDSIIATLSSDVYYSFFREISPCSFRGIGD